MAKLWQFSQVSENKHFLKKCKGGTRENFSKIAQKIAIVLKTQRKLAQMSLYSNLYAFKWKILDTILAQKAASKVPEWPCYSNFRNATQNPHFLKKCKGKFFKTRQKNILRFKGPKAFWWKCHYPLFSIRLNCKDWKKFWRKHQLQKCPNGQVIGIFGGSPKTRILWKSANGGPREIFQKSPKK